MPRKTLQRLHGTAAMAALLLIAVFWSMSLVSWLWLGPDGTRAVKQSIAYALPVLVLAMAVTAGTGARLAGAAYPPLILRKKRRMPFVAANALLVLIPAALWLHWRAQSGTFGTGFHAVQAAELLAGLCNLALLGLNARDGLRLGRRHPAT